MTRRHLSQDRTYREMVRPGTDEVRFQVAVEQTDLLVVAETDLSVEISSFVTRVRGDIKNWILFHPQFLESLVPVPVPDSAPEIVRCMARAAEICGVGPMAAVAGAVSQAVADEFVSRSPNILIENGGDTYLHSTHERVVALLPEPESGAMMGLRIEKDGFPASICASSATIGHSLSLGHGDLVAVRARSGAFADAAATHLCNMLGSAADLGPVLERTRQLADKGLQGIFAQCNGKLAAWGELELVALG
ncbi:UPF0280 family protein [Pseudodesulfovibrio tunisiensis]|uniref:UPF0280 family protein n=1 Tax=Pseudodesulfovibrio tunisiensis TaxID=463192 RepID=UPI001FB3FAEA|nr:UPF0280 family protein [Pseudodesulfovibrio tunisiensis]